MPYGHLYYVAELTIPNVVNKIADIHNWEELGIHLGMEKADIEKISTYHQKEQHQRLVEIWFCRDPSRSWEKVHRAMEAASLAARSRSTHTVLHSSPTSPLGMLAGQTLTGKGDVRVWPARLVWYYITV